jgi:hypothetical protein
MIYALVYDVMNGIERIEVEQAKIPELWCTLIKVKEHSSELSRSALIAENRYWLNGLQYSCMWYLPAVTEHPDLVDILKPMEATKNALF